MELPFWKSMVLYAEYDAEQKKIWEKARREAGVQFPFHLLTQAVFLDLAGWSSQEIGPAVGRKARTIEGWRRMTAWHEMRKSLLLDKLSMHILNRGMTIQDLFDQFCVSHGI